MWSSLWVKNWTRESGLLTNCVYRDFLLCSIWSVLVCRISISWLTDISWSPPTSPTLPLLWELACSDLNDLEPFFRTMQNSTSVFPLYSLVELSVGYLHDVRIMFLIKIVCSSPGAKMGLLLWLEEIIEVHPLIRSV